MIVEWLENGDTIFYLEGITRPSFTDQQGFKTIATIYAKQMLQ